MRAAWYDRRGPARETLVVGDLPDPQPGPGEVRLAVSVSGLSPGDVKKRAGWRGAPMPFPRVIPHSDGAGVIDAVGDGVDGSLVARSAWCYGAQSYRPFGTAAEYVVVPAPLVVTIDAPDDDREARALAEQTACLGIAGITAHRAVFADGSVRGLTVLVHGASGGVGSIAVQMAKRDGGHVIAVVRPNHLNEARQLGADHVLSDDDPELASSIKAVAPQGVHRIAEVDFAAHIDLDAEVTGVGAVISSYASSADRPDIPYWTLGFADTTIRLLGSDDFGPEVKAEASSALMAAVLDGSLRSTITHRVPLEEIARAHELVESGTPGRVIVEVR